MVTQTKKASLQLNLWFLIQTSLHIKHIPKKEWEDKTS